LLPRSVSNGIDSFGVRADLTLPYPSGGLIHLHGSVVMLLTTALGVLILHRWTAFPVTQPEPADIPASMAQLQKISAPAVPQPRPEVLSSAVVSSAGTLIAPSINEVFAAQQQQPLVQQQHARYQPPVTAVTTASIPKPAPAVATAPAPKQAEVVTAPPEKKYKPVTILPGNAKPAIITPEPPPTCRLTTPPPIAVVMPRPAPGIGKIHPCYVIGSLKPVKIP